MLAAVLVVGCSTKQENKKNTANNNTNQPAKSTKEDGFPNWGYDLQQTRNVPYDKITKDNVNKLGVVWQQDGIKKPLMLRKIIL